MALRTDASAPGDRPGQHGRNRAQSQHAQNLALHPHGHQSVPQHGIDRSVARDPDLDRSVARAPDPNVPHPARDLDHSVAHATPTLDPDPDPAPAGLDAPDQLDEMVRRRPHPPHAPSPDSDTRSLPKVTLANSQPPFSAPTR